MGESLVQRLTKTRDGTRLYQQERAIQELTDLICKMMAEQEISRSELAARLGKTKGYVTQLLDGRANMTIRTIADIFTALGSSLHYQDAPLATAVRLIPIVSLETHWTEHATTWLTPIGMSKPVPGLSSSVRLAG